MTCSNSAFDLNAIDALSLNTSGGAFSLSGMSWLVLQAAFVFMSDLDNWCGQYGSGEEALTDTEKALIAEILEGIEADLVPL